MDRVSKVNLKVYELLRSTNGDYDDAIYETIWQQNFYSDRFWKLYANKKIPKKERRKETAYCMDRILFWGEVGSELVRRLEEKEES